MTEKNENLLTVTPFNSSPKSNSTTEVDLNDIIKDYVYDFIAKFSSNYTPKLLVNYLENTLKTLQRSLTKPELKKDLLLDRNLGQVIEDENHVKNLIKLFQRKISETKSTANSYFINQDGGGSQKNSPEGKTLGAVTSSGMIENPESNFFIVESLNEIEETPKLIKKLNFYYLIIISPSNKTVQFLTYDKQVCLNFNLISNLTLSTEQDSKWLDTLFGLQITDYVEKIENKENKNLDYHVLNLNRLSEDIETLNTFKNFTLKTLNVKKEEETFDLTDFTLKTYLLQNVKDSEIVKNLFLEMNYHRNFISTNNSKVMKNLLENDLNYFSAPNQITTMPKLNIN
jgi:hypothetical protein